MSVYFIRETELNECIGCGACVETCPVDAVTMHGQRPEVDQDWCIGCGVCAVSCPAGVISIKRRLERRSPDSFAGLHQQIRKEKGME
jgi:ferredoxin